MSHRKKPSLRSLFIIPSMWASTRQFEPFRARFQLPRNCGTELPGMPLLDIPDTFKIGCVTFADRKSIMTFSPLSVLRRTRFT